MMDMKQSTDYITEEKKKAFEIELDNLKGPKRKEIIDSLEYAKSLGDLSENAEYHQAREDQAKLEARINTIEQILKTSKIISSKRKGDIVEVGSKITVKKEGKKETIVYFLVGHQEADIMEGKISNRSPLGEALIGRKVSDKVSVNTPSGLVIYQILNIS